jgi:hypothetical protein
MRLLAISDIHNNLSCVNKLRAVETNRFDAVVVAGDMGSEMASAMLHVLATFSCPVLYVYGNWDNELDYKTQLAPGAQLLHLVPVRIGAVAFAGFSGCPTHWGRNPIALQTYQEVEDRHRDIVAALKDATESAKWAERVAKYAHEQRLLEAQRKEKKRRTAAYLDQFRALERRRDQDVERAWRPERALRHLRNFHAYQRDGLAAEKKLLAQNRSAMVKRLVEMCIDPATLILVTHERLGHINEHYPGTFMHLYGHIHGFKHTNWQGIHCINVSVLDKLQLMLPRASRRWRRQDEHYANAGTYTVIEIAATRAAVESMQLSVDYPSWKPRTFVRTDAPLVPEEAHFGPYRAPSNESDQTTG